MKNSKYCIHNLTSGPLGETRFVLILNSFPMFEFGGLLKLACDGLEANMLLASAARLRRAMTHAQITRFPSLLVASGPEKLDCFTLASTTERSCSFVRESAAHFRRSLNYLSLSHSGVPAWSWAQTVEIVPVYYFLIHIQEIELSFK